MEVKRKRNGSLFPWARRNVRCCLKIWVYDDKFTDVKWHENSSKSGFVSTDTED